MSAGRVIPLGRLCFELGVVVGPVRQHRPRDPRQLVRQGHDDDVLVLSFQKAARPPTQRRLPPDEVRQRRPGAMDQILTQVAIAAFADAEQARFSAGRHLPWN